MAGKRKAATSSKKMKDGEGEPMKKSRKKVVEENIEEVKQLISVGNAEIPVDSLCLAKVGKAHVYIEDNIAYDAMLNQTNIQFNNNKFYLIQLLKDVNKANYSLWLRWGRVGKNGQNSLLTFGNDLEMAKTKFREKFFDKTKNDWNDKDNFNKVPGKYDLLEMDFKPTLPLDQKKVKEIKVDVKFSESTLDDRVQKLMKLICDIETMEETVIEMKYDSKKAPLGKLTEEQIKGGYSALKEIDDLIKEGNTKRNLFVEASNRFYTRIPHNFGMKAPPVINTEVEIIAKMQLLQVLSDIEVAIRILDEKFDSIGNPVDRHYQALNCQLTPLDSSDDMFKTIEKYLFDTHAKTHNHYKMKVVNVFNCDRRGESQKFKSLDNKMLLWHGSRLSNVASILKQGLRIAPPEAPSTGYMFGKGIYFADRSSKSANYCFASSSSNVGILLLCQVI
ncbi:Poly [ADP-ribose] polymerase 2 [Chamberlinius hualienensis]